MVFKCDMTEFIDMIRKADLYELWTSPKQVLLIPTMYHWKLGKSAGNYPLTATKCYSV